MLGDNAFKLVLSQEENVKEKSIISENVLHYLPHLVWTFFEVGKHAMGNSNFLLPGHIAKRETGRNEPVVMEQMAREIRETIKLGG